MDNMERIQSVVNYVKEHLIGNYDSVGHLQLQNGAGVDVYIQKETKDILLITTFIHPSLIMSNVNVRGVELMTEIKADKIGIDLVGRTLDQEDSFNLIMNKTPIGRAIDLLLESGLQILKAYVFGNMYSIGYVGRVQFSMENEHAYYGILKSSNTGCDTFVIKDTPECGFWYIVDIPDEVIANIGDRNNNPKANIKAFKQQLKEQIGG